GRSHWNTRGPDDHTAEPLDLVRVGVPGRLTPRVVGIDDVPSLRHLDEGRREGDRLSGRVVEGSEGEPTTPRRRDPLVQAPADHVNDPVLLPDTHTRQADVREKYAQVGIDPVLGRKLLGLPPARVDPRLIVLHD